MYFWDLAVLYVERYVYIYIYIYIYIMYIIIIIILCLFTALVIIERSL